MDIVNLIDDKKYQEAEAKIESLFRQTLVRDNFIRKFREASDELDNFKSDLENLNNKYKPE